MWLEPQRVLAGAIDFECQVPEIEVSIFEKDAHFSALSAGGQLVGLSRLGEWQPVGANASGCDFQRSQPLDQLFHVS